MKKQTYFTKNELILWFSSLGIVGLSFLLFDKNNYISLFASLIGTTALIFNAKGNPLGQLLIIIFSILYGIISYGYSYYGEMITYVGMSLPMAVIALISWLRNPYNGKRSQVKVNTVSKKELVFMLFLSLVVTVLFYFILRELNTSNLIPSTFSVITSFIAAYLTFRRSPYFALAYGINDLVLLVLWTLAALEDTSYLSVLSCFVVFLINDIYSFISWLKMQKLQNL